MKTKKRSIKANARIEGRRNFGIALGNLIERRDVTMRAIAGSMAEPTSKISRIVRGELRCDRDTLDGILLNFPSATDKAELAMAHVSDCVSPSAWKTLRHYRKPTPPTPNPGLWSSQGIEAWNALLQAPEDMVPGIERLLIDIASIHGLKVG